ncbi:MAG: putative glycoside hydrolase [candidate division WOR-3 bacterium]|nr:putative glycoside hydrolase [candidate division WOR-3 bacterium]
MLSLIFAFSPFDIPPAPYSPPVIKGIYLSPGVIHSGYRLKEFYRMIDLGLLNAAILDIKDVNGRVMFSLYKDFVREAKKKGIYLIARQCVFKDKYFAFKDSGRFALKDTKGHIWFEGRSGYWVDPSLKEVRDYNLRIIDKAYKTGFDEIQFDYIRYPSGDKPYKNDTNKLANILNFLDMAIEKKSKGKRMSLTLYGYALWGYVLKKEGQNLERMATKVDAIYPMLYPSHFKDDFMADSTKEWRTYSIVYKSIKEARNRLSNKDICIIPYLQAFDWKQTRLGKAYVKNQLKAAYDAETDGFILWEAKGDYKRGFQELFDFDIERSIEKLRMLPVGEDDRKRD